MENPKNKTFVIPQNSLETETIIELLKKNGYEEGVNLFVTKQGQDASWESLEPEIKDALNQTKDVMKTKQVNIDEKHPASLNDIVGWEIHDYHALISSGGGGGSAWHFDYSLKGTYEDYLSNPYGEYKEEIDNRDGTRGNCGKVEVKPAHKTIEYTVSEPVHPNIHGVEMHGDNPYNATNINHDSKSTSLEKVADLIGASLTIKEKFISANAKGSTDAMEQLANTIHLTQEDKERIISEIKEKEREIQNLPHNQKTQATQEHTAHTAEEILAEKPKTPSKFDNENNKYNSVEELIANTNPNKKETDTQDKEEKATTEKQSEFKKASSFKNLFGRIGKMISEKERSDGEKRNEKTNSGVSGRGDD